MIDTSVTIYGNLTREPDLSMNNGVARCNFRVASTERRYDRASNQFVDGKTVFISVTCWRLLAQNVAASAGKGDGVMVVGRLTQREWTKPDGGPTITLTEIDADVVGLDLRKGISTRVRKMARAAGVDHTFDSPSFEAARPEDAPVSPEASLSGLDDEGAGIDRELAGVGAEQPF